VKERESRQVPRGQRALAWRGQTDADASQPGGHLGRRVSLRFAGRALGWAAGMEACMAYAGCLASAQTIHFTWAAWSRATVRPTLRIGCQTSSSARIRPIRAQARSMFPLSRGTNPFQKKKPGAQTRQGPGPSLIVMGTGTESLTDIKSMIHSRENHIKSSRTWLPCSGTSGASDPAGIPGSPTPKFLVLHSGALPQATVYEGTAQRGWHRWDPAGNRNPSHGGIGDGISWDRHRIGCDGSRLARTQVGVGKVAGDGMNPSDDRDGRPRRSRTNASSAPLLRRRSGNRGANPAANANGEQEQGGSESEVVVGLAARVYPSELTCDERISYDDHGEWTDPMQE